MSKKIEFISCDDSTIVCKTECIDSRKAFRIEFKDESLVDGNWEQCSNSSISGSTTFFTIENLKPKTTYEIRLIDEDVGLVEMNRLTVDTQAVMFPYLLKSRQLLSSLFKCCLRPKKHAL